MDIIFYVITNVKKRAMFRQNSCGASSFSNYSFIRAFVFEK